MPKINYFALPADVPERAMDFYRNVFGWHFELGWEYDTPQGRERYWHVTMGESADGIRGGLTRREYPGQPISVGIEVATIDECTALIEKCGGKTIVRKVAVPGVAWFAMCQDTEGNSFAVFQPDAGAR